MSDEVPQGALAGVRIIDFSMAFAGAAGTAMLGDYGADVIKVESTRGDIIRRAGSFFDEEAEGSLFLTWNRSKRSIVIDLRNPEATDVLLQLLDHADVLVENWRTGVAEEVGVGYDAVAARNPNIVYCSMSGFGHAGPLAGAQGTDPVVQSLSGIMSVTGEPGRVPVLVGVPIADFHGAMQTAQMVMLGLLARDRTGRGQHVRASMLGGLLAMQSTRAQEYFASGRAPQPFGSQHPFVVPLQAFKTKDGAAVAGIGQSDEWPAFCKAVGREEMTDDSRFSSDDVRLANRAELGAILEAEFLKRTTAEWTERFGAEAALISPIWTIADVLESDQVKASGFIEQVDHWRLGRLPQLRPHITMSGTPARMRTSPRLGEHTEDVLRESGFSPDEVAGLLARGVAVRDERPARPETQPPPAAPRARTPVESGPPYRAPSALAAVRIVDLATTFAGAAGAALMADYGAEVIKVGWTGGQHGDDSNAVTADRGKRSVVIDYRTPEGVAVLLRLIDQADVVVQDASPGVAERLGLGYASVAARNQRTVFCSITPFGETGPLAGTEGTDAVIQARSGIMSVTGEPGRTPLFVGAPIADFTGAVQTAQMIMLGLLARERTGRGQLVQASLLGGMLSMLSTRAQEYFAAGRVPQPFGPQHPLVVPLQVFKTKDSLAVAAIPGGSSNGWARFCNGLGCDELIEDDRFTTNDRRVANRDVLSRLLQAEFMKKTTDEWIESFRVAGGVINPVWSIADVLGSDQVKALGFVEEIDHWRLGTVKQLRPPFFLSDTPGVVHASPRPGEHTVEVLEEAGFERRDIEALLARRIATAP